ncbi:anti-sigma factor antagonist [Roseovarius salis]|uniref:STAS domain-containing protein n=1 Tax=Roseovarius salis TaxID=3376063 RepID=UPI0037C56D63
MQLECSRQQDALIVVVRADRIDSAAAIRFKDAMRAETENAPRRVILDLGDVVFVDSSGLGAIVAVMKFLSPERSLELAGLNPDVARVFRLTRMDSVFEIHADASAPQSLGAG